MKITREQLKSLVDEVLQEEKDYQSFFQAMLKKHGVNSPADFKSDEEKKDFFNKVEKSWNGVSERLKEIRKESAADVNTANIPASVASKLDQATDKMKDAKMNNQQKLQIIARVIDAIGLDKMNLAASVNKLRTKMEMTEEEMTQYQKVFKSMMGKFGINSPAELDSDEKKKEFFSAVDNAYTAVDEITKESVNEGKLTEGRYDADLDKIEAAVKNATSFMNVGTELKKAGIKYDFSTSMIPMYTIKVSGNTIAVVNKKYAAGAEREVKDIAIGLLN
jgi:hypothetical protein